MECSERRSYSERDDVEGMVVVEKSESVLFYEFKNVKALSVSAHILRPSPSTEEIGCLHRPLAFQSPRNRDRAQKSCCFVPRAVY